MNIFYIGGIGLQHKKYQVLELIRLVWMAVLWLLSDLNKPGVILFTIKFSTFYLMNLIFLN